MFGRFTILRGVRTNQDPLKIVTKVKNPQDSISYGSWLMAEWDFSNLIAD